MNGFGVTGSVKKPVRRSAVRIWLGAHLRMLKRYVYWYLSCTRFASVRLSEDLPAVVAEHRTPLYRPLRGVDLWMQHNKVRNLRLAVGRLDGIVVRPGETMSFWRTVGKPSKRKGYVPGMVLFYGTVRPGIGGGLCQLTNLIYWLALHTPLSVVERHRHSYDVFPDAGRTQPFGSGATCAYNYIDLQIYNPTDRPYQLRLRVTDSHLVGQWRTVEPPRYRYEVYETDHRIERQPWGAYTRHNVIRRRVILIETGETVADEFVTSNDAIMMYEPMLPPGPG